MQGLNLKYVVTARGPLPANLGEKIVQAHAEAIRGGQQQVQAPDGKRASDGWKGSDDAP
jgi:hypothetical protein